MNKKPLILVTNDDGIVAPGIKALVDIVKEFGEVVVYTCTTYVGRPVTCTHAEWHPGVGGAGWHPGGGGAGWLPGGNSAAGRAVT